MPPEIVVFPNVLPAVISYLTQKLASEFGDTTTTVSATVPTGTALSSKLPYVLVIPRGGGAVVSKQLDEVVLNINIYHRTDRLSALDALGYRVRALVESMREQSFPTHGLAITRTTDQSGLSRLPDADPLITRVGLTVSLLVRPL